MSLRLFLAVLLVGMLLWGCTRPGEKQAEVSGKVTYRGKPLPGGVIVFSGVNGYTARSVISPEGAYKLKAPIGKVQISIDNRMLDPNNMRKKTAEQRSKGMGLKLPAEVAAKQKVDPNEEVKGTYVQIPNVYGDPTTSGLTYTVQPGPQTHDVELSDNPGP